MLTAVCFWTVGFAACLWTLAGHEFSVVLTPANSAITGKSACVSTSGAHSSAFSYSTTKRFFCVCGVCTLWSYKSFPEDVKQIPLLVSQLLFATSSMLTLTLDLKHLASFFCCDHPNMRKSTMTCKTSPCVNLNSTWSNKMMVLLLLASLDVTSG